MKTFIIIAFALGATLISSFIFLSQELHTVNIKNTRQLHDFFTYQPDRIPFVSAHRGGPRAGFPENCIETFENTLQHAFAMMEIDPHFTKDSLIVLMHDATLDRTTNGSGKVSDYTYNELQKLKLKDTEGNLTDFNIPTLDEVLDWAKGKTILVLDEKDVPMETRVKKIQDHKAQTHAIVIAYSMEDVKKCYEMDKDIVMEVPLADMDKVKEFEKTGVPYQNIVAFITHAEPKDTKVFAYLHSKGVMCMRGSSRNIDRAYWNDKSLSKSQLEEGYKKMVQSGTDIIEADLGIEAGMALQNLMDEKSSKAKYFNIKSGVSN